MTIIRDATIDRPESPRRTALLDLDGTLVDSAALITEHLAAALVVAGGPRLAPDELRWCVGPPLEEALPALGLSDAQIEATIVAYRSSYARVAADNTPLYPGIPAMLRRLGDAGLRVVLATSKPESLARRIVAGTGIAEHFVLVGGAEPATGRIGKAAVVGSVLHRLGLDPRSEPVVMVGDRHHDVDGAGTHGLATVGVAWGYAEPGELDGAQLVVADPAELAAVLTGDAIWDARRDRATPTLKA